MRFVLLLLALAQDAGQHFARGRELAAQGLYEDAIEEYEKANQIAESPAVLIELASAYEKVDRCKAAVGAWEKLLKTELSEDQRAQVAQRMETQRWRLSHNECKDGPKKIAAEPGRGRWHHERARSNEPEAKIEHFGWGFGFRVGIVFGRIGASDTLAGTPGYSAVEDVEGLHLRLALQIPLARTADRTPIVQLEPFFAYSYYGFSTPVVVVDMGGAQLATITGGDAMMTLFGAAARFTVPLSERSSFEPSLGFGLGLQHIAMDTDMCKLSTSVGSPVMTLDLPFRVASEAHHAFYFTPASLQVIFPASSSGDAIDGGCFGMPGGTATSKAFYKLDKTQLNFAIDVGYIYEF